MTRSVNATAWALVCRLFSQDSPVLESALSEVERGGLATLDALKAIKPHTLDLRFALCPYCELLRGSVVQGKTGLVCQCPDCGAVPLDPSDTRAWVFDADWLIRKLRAAFGVPARQGQISVVNGVWRIGMYQRRSLILARSLDLVLKNPASLARAGVRGSNPAWLITPKPLRDVVGDAFDGVVVWLPLEERFSLYGGNLQFTEPGARLIVAEPEAIYAVHGPFTTDFRKVHLDDWPHGPIDLTVAQAAVFKALWHYGGEPRVTETIMTKAGLSSDKPIDVFKVKSHNQGDPRYEGPLHAYKTLVTTDQHAGTYAMPCAEAVTA